MMCHSLSGKLFGRSFSKGLLITIVKTWNRTMSSNVHRIAQEGFKQGDHYDQNRPTYTASLVSNVLKNLSKSKTDVVGLAYDILELGAGTGLFTTQILPRITEGTKYLATEPSEDFLSVLRTKIKDLPVETQVSSSTNIPLKNNSVQNIICAQCFHWFANDESLQEIYRVLAPGGRLILVWNDKDFKNVKWLGQMEDVLKLYYDDTPRKILGKWKNVFDGNDKFRCIEHSMEPGIQLTGNKAFVLNHFTSISVIARLSGIEKQAAVDKFRAVLDKHFSDNQEDIKILFNSDLYCTEKV